MAHPLRVLQLLPALHAGGVERSTLEISAALVQGGHESWVVSAGGRLVAELQAAGGRHIAHAIGRKAPRTLRHVLTLRRLITELRPDIVHARSRLPAWLAWMALHSLPAATRPRFVTTVHGLNSPGAYSAIMTRSDRVICVSQCVLDHVRRHYPATPPARLAVIPRGLDTAHYHPAFRPDPAWRDEFVRNVPLAAEGLLLTLPGRGTRLKGHSEAIQLLADLRDRGLDARLLLLGARESGREHYLRELLATARRLGVGDYLAITPFRTDAREVMAISQLVLQLSSRPEAFGRTVTEALSLGRPVLGYDHGGVGELLAEHFPPGRVPLHDRAELAERAVALLREPPDLRAVHPPSLHDMQTQTLSLYRSLLEAPR